MLLVGLLRAGPIRERMVPALTLLTFLALAPRVFHRALPPRPGSRSSPARSRIAWTSGADPRHAVRGRGHRLRADVLARARAARIAGTASTTRCCCSACSGWRVLVSAQNLVTLFLGFELLSIPLYVLCASESRREGSLESGLKYLVIGSVGSATLVYGLALVYGATGSTRFAGIANAIRAEPARRRPARQPDGATPVSGWRSSGSPSRRRWRRSTSGRRTCTRAPRPRSPRSWPPPPRRRRSACSCASSTSP